VLDAPPKKDADGVKTPKNVFPETRRDPTDLLKIAQNGFSKAVSVQNVLSTKTVPLAHLIHFVAGAPTPTLVLSQSVKI